MTAQESTRYDAFRYHSHAYDSSHPDRLSTIASIYGMEPAPPERCRVLELGCGEGGNLIPMAYGYPDSEFVGIDLSVRAIEQGQKSLAAVGLKNIELHHLDIAEMTPASGQFDYIIAHGVYSWVPPAVREKMLRIFKVNLNPHGVVYVSYNAYPGSHLRNLTRDMMLFHIRSIAEPEKRLEQARAILKFLAEATAEGSVHGAVMRDQHERVRKMSDAILFHDDLDEVSTPFLLHQVASAAAQHGLQYLSDATFSRRSLGRHAEQTRSILEQFPSSDFMARDQYQDFIEGHGFRRTLLCHDEIKLQRNLPFDFVRRYCVSSSAKAVTENADPTASGDLDFKTEEDAAMATSHPLSKAAILYLGSRWPEAVSFQALIEGAEKILSERGGKRFIRAEDDVEKLVHVVQSAVLGGHFYVHLFPPRLTALVSERPQASLLARKQAGAASLVTNLRHDHVRLEDDVVCKFIQLVDGTRDIDTLVADFKVAVASLQTMTVKPDDVTRASVEKHLGILAKLGLLES